MDYSKYTDDSRMLSVDFELFGLVHGIIYIHLKKTTANKAVNLIFTN